MSQPAPIKPAAVPAAPAPRAPQPALVKPAPPGAKAPTPKAGSEVEEQASPPKAPTRRPAPIGVSAAGVAAGIVSLAGAAAGFANYLQLGLPPLISVKPLVAVMVLLFSTGLICAAARRWSGFMRAMAFAALAVAGLVIAEWLANMRGGLEDYVFAQAARLADPVHLGRPSVLVALAVAACSLGLISVPYPPRRELGGADMLGVLGLAGAAMLAWISRSDTGVVSDEALLVFLAATGLLLLNPSPALSAMRQDNPTLKLMRRGLPFGVFLSAAGVVGAFAGFWFGMIEPGGAICLALVWTSMLQIWMAESFARVYLQHERARVGDSEKREKRARYEGMVDQLTGLLNRRGWDMKLGSVEVECAAMGLNAAVVMIDLDGLKQINDGLGHAEGDAFIKRAALALRAGMRKEDILARLGGDEFAYIAVGCKQQDAEIVLSRLRRSLQEHDVEASLGYAMRDAGKTLTGAVELADHAMYAIKRQRKAAKAAAQQPGSGPGGRALGKSPVGHAPAAPVRR